MVIPNYQPIWIRTTAATGAVVTAWVTGTNATSLFTQDFFTVTSTGLTACSSNNTFIHCAGLVFEVDEEDYVNHAEYYALACQRGVTFRIRTAEEKRLAAEAAERARVETERRDRERQQALARSREFLLCHLSAEQRATFERNRWFIVRGDKSGMAYRIKDAGLNGNIDVMRGEAVAARLCCHCVGELPVYDHYLAQKIALQWDEERFLKTANLRAA
jgi:hypothetical protein